jgi:hypothetical protein
MIWIGWRGALKMLAWPTVGLVALVALVALAFVR